MVSDQMRYDRMVEDALRGVVRRAIDHAKTHGLSGDHHFYLTFASQHPEVVMPDYLREQYPEEMTIVLQHQFYDLDADDAGFSVTLSFNSERERLHIPFEAITTFADPSVNFALHFQKADGDAESPVGKRQVGKGLERPAPNRPDGGTPQLIKSFPPQGNTGAEEGDATDQEENPEKVVILDHFRNKES